MIVHKHELAELAREVEIMRRARTTEGRIGAWQLVFVHIPLPYPLHAYKP